MRCLALHRSSTFKLFPLPDNQTWFGARFLGVSDKFNWLGTSGLFSEGKNNGEDVGKCVL